MSSTDYVGIDYGNGATNIDTSNGIRYGVIPLNEVCQAWCDSSEFHYTPYCPHCGNELTESNDGGSCTFPCEHCEETIKDGEQYADECDFTYIDDGEYKATASNDGDIFITKAPYYTHAQFCSPCAPGAGYLMNPCENGPKVYCFGHDWFYDSQEYNGAAPYPVYRVSDDSRVLPD